MEPISTTVDKDLISIKDANYEHHWLLNNSEKVDKNMTLNVA